MAATRRSHPAGHKNFPEYWSVSADKVCDSRNNIVASFDQRKIQGEGGTLYIVIYEGPDPVKDRRYVNPYTGEYVKNI